MSHQDAQLRRVYEQAADSPAILYTLKDNLPASIAIYRRIQFLGTSEHAHIYATISNHNQTVANCFAIVFADRSLRPETELYLFLQHQASSVDQTCSDCSEVVLAMLAKVANLSVQKQERLSDMKQCRYTAHSHDTNLILAGSVARYAAIIMDQLGLLDPRFPSIDTPYAKYIFHKQHVVEQVQTVPAGLVWGQMKEKKHLELVMSRTEIPRQLKTLASLQSIGVFVKDTGQPIAWGFIGVDASLSSLHVEEEWRGHGIAKSIATNLLTESCGNEGYGHADVGLDNAASRRVLESIGGSDEARVFWLRIDLAKVLSMSQTFGQTEH